MYKYFYQITFFCLNIARFANPKTLNLPEIDAYRKLVFPHLVQKAQNDTGIMDLNLTKKQSRILFLVYEHVLCDKLHKHFKLIETFSFFMPSTDTTKIKNAYQKCNDHEHLNAHTLKDFNVHDARDLSTIIVQRYGESHGLTKEIIEKFHNLMIKLCKAELANKV